MVEGEVEVVEVEVEFFGCQLSGQCRREGVLI